MKNIRFVITRTVLVVSFISFFTDIASEMLYPVMPIYLRTIGFSVLLIGILEGLAEATAGLSKGYFGQLSDRVGKRAVFVQFGYALSAISKPLLAVFAVPVWVFFARTLDRLGKGVRTAARDALLSAEVSKADKGKVFGLHRAFDTAGAAIGPMLALLYLHYHPGEYKWLFVAAIIPGVIAIALSFFLKDKPTIGAKNSIAKPGIFSFFGYWKIAGKSYKLLIIGLLIFALFNSSDAFLLLALKNNGFSDQFMIKTYIFYNLVYALLSFPLGILADKKGLPVVLISGLVVFALVYLFMGFAVASWQFIILFGMYAVYAAATEGISKAWISNLAMGENLATAIGLYTSLSSICTLLSSSLAGFIWFAFGMKTMFILSATGVLISALFLGWMQLNRKFSTN